jgi:hypothetical protein
LREALVTILASDPVMSFLVRSVLSVLWESTEHILFGLSSCCTSGVNGSVSSRCDTLTYVVVKSLSDKLVNDRPRHRLRMQELSIPLVGHSSNLRLHHHLPLLDTSFRRRRCRLLLILAIIRPPLHPRTSLTLFLLFCAVSDQSIVGHDDSRWIFWMAR